jgi:hypothetical protein
MIRRSRGPPSAATARGQLCVLAAASSVPGASSSASTVPQPADSTHPRSRNGGPKAGWCTHITSRSAGDSLVTVSVSLSTGPVRVNSRRTCKGTENNRVSSRALTAVASSTCHAATAASP